MKNSRAKLLVRRARMLAAGILIAGEAIAVAQIPSMGADFPTLLGLHWGMTMQEVRDCISGKKGIKNLTPTILTYQDKLLNNTMDVYLKFMKQDSLLVLYSISAPVDESNEVLHAIEKYFVDRYGNNYYRKKDYVLSPDGEKKIWRFRNEIVGFQTLVDKEKILGAEITYDSPKIKFNGAIKKISIKGNDFPTLAGLQWGMSMQTAFTSIRRKYTIKDSTYSEFCYVDTLSAKKAKITMKFDESDSLWVLYAINAEIIGPSKQVLQSLTNTMIDRYGNTYETKKESKLKFLYTINFEALTWHLENESIGLRIMSQGDEVKSITVLYAYNNTKR
jgi:hypothetical protein